MMAAHRRRCSTARFILALLATLSLCLTPTVSQDRASLTRLCASYAASGGVRIGVLDKGDSDFPMSAWGGVFDTMATNFLNRFGCTTRMTLYTYEELQIAVRNKSMEFVFCNPIQGTQFTVQYGARPMLSLTNEYTPLDVSLPFAGVTATLDQLGGVFFYARSNMSRPTEFDNHTIAFDRIIQRRAIIEEYAPSTLDDMIRMSGYFLPLNLSVCATSRTSLGGFQAVAYEFFKKGRVIESLYRMIFTDGHNESIRRLLLGDCDFAITRTGHLDTWVNRTLIAVSTLVVIDNQPTQLFPLFLSTPLYPEWPILRMPWVEDALANALTVPLTALSILTNTPETNAIRGAYFSYPFSYDVVMKLMLDLDVLGTGECGSGEGRRLDSDPLPLDPSKPHGCFPCPIGTFTQRENATTTCARCKINSISTNNITDACQPCAEGQVTTQAGASQCVPATKQIVATDVAHTYVTFSLTLFVLLLLLLVSLFVFSFRHHPVLLAGSPLFLGLVLLGLASLCASLLPRAFENDALFAHHDRQTPPSARACVADIFLANIGYTLISGSLLMKALRLYGIFSSTGLVSRRWMSERNLLAILGLLLIIESTILIALTQAWPIKARIQTLDSDSEYFVCELDEDAPYTYSTLYLPVIVVTRFVLLIATTIAAFLTRNLPAAFNESTQLVSCMYNLLFFSILLPAIDTGIGRGKKFALLSYALSILFICLLTLGILFLPKFLLIRRVGLKAAPPTVDRVLGYHDTCSSSVTMTTIYPVASQISTPNQAPPAHPRETTHHENMIEMRSPGEQLQHRRRPTPTLALPRVRTNTPAATTATTVIPDYPATGTAVGLGILEFLRAHHDEHAPPPPPHQREERTVTAAVDKPTLPNPIIIPNSFDGSSSSPHSPSLAVDDHANGIPTRVVTSSPTGAADSPVPSPRHLNRIRVHIPTGASQLRQIIDQLARTATPTITITQNESREQQ